MSLEENKTLSRRYLQDGFKNPSVFDELLSPDASIYLPGTQQPVKGAQGIRRVWDEYRKAFPDLHADVEEIVAEGDKVAVRYTMKGTQKGEFQGISPTGKQVTVPGIELLRIDRGKIVEDRSEFDQLLLLQQLGVTSIPGRMSRSM